ncbi:hypothetical protein ACFQ3J_21020 [Paenibacillus provencensis]|uniref:DUF3081 domain-containing protein n=1 Tax=Paenibacillus provencensis TaxID=441151 RepID=A0ABW3PTL9_9BACL
MTELMNKLDALQVIEQLHEVYTGEITYDYSDPEAHYFRWQYSDELHGPLDSKAVIRVEYEMERSVYVQKEHDSMFEWIMFLSELKN